MGAEPDWEVMAEETRGDLIACLFERDAALRDLTIITQKAVQQALTIGRFQEIFDRVRALVASGGTNGWLTVEDVRRAVEGAP